MFVQGLRVRAHIVGTFLYAFGAMCLGNGAVFVTCLVTATPAVVRLDSATRWVLLILALTCQSFWTACVTVLGAASFKTTGMAAGVVGLTTLMLVGTAIGLVTVQALLSASQSDDDLSVQQPPFFANPYPAALSLAPYFGFCRALWVIGDKGSNSEVLVALALTVVQGILYALVGAIIYTRQVSRRIDLSNPCGALSGTTSDETKGPTATNTTLGDVGASAQPLARFDSTTKAFGNKVVLNSLSLDIQHGECLGLLGPNGAGKSTAFKIMAGLLKSTSGDAEIEGFSIHTACDKARHRLGWCPQFPRLWPDLTVADHLGLFVMLRGLPSPFSLYSADRNQGRRTVRKFADVMQLGGATLTKKSSQLSGGMRRRLSLAISLVGAPPLMILDEPTTGLDPLTRGGVWDLLGALRRDSSRRGIIVSTHSMEEATALCNRIAILTHGCLQVTGTQDELKRQYGTGYTVQFSVATDTVVDVRQFLIDQIHKDATIKTSTGNVYSCHVPIDAKLGELFRNLSMADRNGLLQEWLVAETSLEDVFVRIVVASDDELSHITDATA